MRLVKKRATGLSEEQVSKLLDLVLVAEKENQAFFKTCIDSKKWVKGDQWDPDEKDESIRRAQLTVNLANAHVRAIVPTIFFQDPTWKASPENPNQANSAEVWESYMNVYTRRTQYKKNTKKVVTDGVVYPEGWKKWVVMRKEEDNIFTGEEIKSDSGVTDGALSEGGEKGEAGPTGIGNIQAAVGIRIPPTNVITDSPDREIDNCRFIAVKYRRPVSEIAKDERYKSIWKQLEMKSTETNDPQQATHDTFITMSEEDENLQKTAVEAEQEMLVFYEIWVFQLVEYDLYKQVVVIAEDPKGLMRKLEGWEEFIGPYVSGYPFNKLVLNPVPDEHGQSELMVWASLQRAINWMVSRLVEQTVNDKQVWAINPNEVKNSELVKQELESGKTTVIVDVTGDANAAIQHVTRNGVPQQDWQLLSVLQTLLQQVTGFGQNRRGSAGIRTATEASIIEQSAQIRTDEKVDIVAEFIKRDGQILRDILRKIATGDEVFMLTGRRGPIKWGTFTQEDAGWSPDIDVEPESFRKVVSQERLQSYQFFMQAAMGLVPVMGAKVDFVELLRRMAEELELPSPDRLVLDNTPDEVKQIMEIMSMMVTGEPIPVEPGENHEAEANMVDEFQGSAIFSSIDAPIQQIILEHGIQHREMAEQIESASNTPPANASNDFDQFTSNGNPASEARQSTASDRVDSGVPTGEGTGF